MVSSSIFFILNYRAINLAQYFPKKCLSFSFIIISNLPLTCVINKLKITVLFLHFKMYSYCYSYLYSFVTQVINVYINI